MRIYYGILLPCGILVNVSINPRTILFLFANKTRYLQTYLATKVLTIFQFVFLFSLIYHVI